MADVNVVPWSDSDEDSDVDPSDVPDLEDMSDEITAARKMRDQMQPSGHDAALYEAVVNDAIKAPPKAPPAVTVGCRVKIQGLVNAQQYNGRTGKVKKLLPDQGRAVVKLDGAGDVELKAKLENCVPDTSMKGGFLSSSSSSSATSAQGGPEVFKPTGKVEGALDELKNLGINKDDVPEWMKPSNDLLHKVNSDKELASAVDNPRINRAIEEVSKDPQAWLKYKDDPEISSYFMKMMGVFGKQFEEHEAKTESKGKKDGSGKPLMQEVKTTGSKKVVMIEEISTSGAAQAKRAKMGEAKAQRKGVDYSKWDVIDSDDEEGAKPRSSLPGVGALPKVKKDDLRVKAALANPKVQRVLNTLKTSSDAEEISRLMAEDSVREGVQVLIAAGVVDIRPP